MLLNSQCGHWGNHVRSSFQVLTPSGHGTVVIIMLCLRWHCVLQVYADTAQQAGFDGPYLIELTVMLLLSKVYPSLSNSPAYRRYFHDLRGADLERARQLSEDPYMLMKFKVCQKLSLLLLCCLSSLAFLSSLYRLRNVFCCLWISYLSLELRQAQESKAKMWSSQRLAPLLLEHLVYLLFCACLRDSA